MVKFLFFAAPAVMLTSAAFCADPVPTKDQIVAIYNRQPEKGAWVHRTTTTTVFWSDKQTIMEDWQLLAADGTACRRSETYSLDAKGEKASPPLISILSAEGFWAVVPAKKRAVRWPPPPPTTQKLPPASVVFYDPATWKTIGIEKSRIEGKDCWALVSEVPPASREYFAKQAAPFKKMAGVESLDKFIPEKFRLVVDSTCTNIVAKEYVAPAGLVVSSERIRELDAPPDNSTFAIPQGYERIQPDSMDAFFKATGESPK